MAARSSHTQDDPSRLQGENRHLRETVTALREAMDRMRGEEQERRQHALAAARDEIAQLRGTITALREKLELLKIEDDRRLCAVEQAGRDEARQLQEMILRLREQLERHEEG